MGRDWLGVVGEFEKTFPQGLKPRFIFQTFAARLKPCPDTSCCLGIYSGK